jgi:CRP-like cAMP-binding protein
MGLAMGAGAPDAELLDMLKEHPLFSLLRESQVREVAETAKLMDFGKDEIIIHQRDSSPDFFVILKGLVEVRQDDHPLARFGPGQFFGETALVNDSTRIASVIAVRPTSCLVLSGSQLRAYPALVVKLLEETTRRNREIAVQSSRRTEEMAKQLPAEETAVEFTSEKTGVLFDSLVKSFTEDYMLKRLYLDQAGWRTVGDLAKATKIPHATLYGKHGNYGPFLAELLSRGLVETRVFTGQRGRGGEVLRARIAYDKEPVKRYVDRTVLKRKSDRK